MLRVPKWTAAIPALGVAWALATYVRRGTLPEALWMCNVVNLILAAAIAGRSAFLAWLAAPWLALGVPLWIWDTAIEGRVNPHAFVTHVAATVVAVLAVRGTRPPRWSWVSSVALGAVVQLVSRFATPPDLNVNASHRAYRGFEDLFGHYAVYWVASLIAIGATLALLQWSIGRMGRPPPPRVPSLEGERGAERQRDQRDARQ